MDANQREYVTQTVDELTKKTREDNQRSRVDGARMYATPGNPHCPVASFKKYVSKLNDECDFLFQTPKQTRPESGPWYSKTPMGKNTLGDSDNVNSDTTVIVGEDSDCNVDYSDCIYSFIFTMVSCV